MSAILAEMGVRHVIQGGRLAGRHILAQQIGQRIPSRRGNRRIGRRVGTGNFGFAKRADQSFAKQTPAVEKTFRFRDGVAAATGAPEGFANVHHKQQFVRTCKAAYDSRAKPNLRIQPESPFGTMRRIIYRPYVAWWPFRRPAGPGGRRATRAGGEFPPSTNRGVQFPFGAGSSSCNRLGWWGFCAFFRVFPGVVAETPGFKGAERPHKAYYAIARRKGLDGRAGAYSKAAGRGNGGGRGPDAGWRPDVRIPRCPRMAEPFSPPAGLPAFRAGAAVKPLPQERRIIYVKYN